MSASTKSPGRHLDDGPKRTRNGAGLLIEDAEEAIDNLGNKVRDQVCDRPLTSLAVSSALGVLIGLLVSRRN